jgi:inner membrane protein
MDIFTHWFFSYLVNFGFQTLRYNEYAMVFGIVIGVIPDFDVLLYPVGKRYPIWRHRGASHSIFFIAIETIILAFIFAPIIDVWVIALIAIGMISGLGHICLDVLTTIGIPVFWPFSKREVHLDLERAINPYFMGLSIFFIIFLFQLREIKFHYSTYLLLINAIGISIVLYYLFKLMLKIYIQKRFSTHEFKIKALPTAGFFKWYLVGKKFEGDLLRLKYCRYYMLNRELPKFRFFNCNCKLQAKSPLDSKEKVKSYTYNLKEVKSFIMKFKYPLAEVVENYNEQHWTVFWFPLELMGLNRAMAIQVDVDLNGKYTTKHAYFRKYSDI